MEKFVGKLVVVNWNLSFLTRTKRDPIDPDVWVDTGFLAQSIFNTSLFQLYFHPSSVDYSAYNMISSDCFDKYDVQQLIVSSNTSLKIGDLLSVSIQALNRHSFTFTSKSNGGGSYSMGSTVKENSCDDCSCDTSGCSGNTPIVKSCNTCKHFLFLSDRCQLKSMRMTANNVCNDWTT